MGQTERRETPLEREAVVSLATASAARPARRPRRWLQFGLRTLLAFMLIAGVAGGLLARWIARANQQREIVKRLRAAGVIVEYDFDPFKEPTLFNASDDPQYFWQDVDLWHKVVRVDRPHFGESDPQAFELIAKLPDLEAISLSKTIHVEGKNGFPLLASRNRLRRLDIPSRPLPPGAAARIRECTALTSLWVDVDRNSGGELAKLNGLEHLQWLTVTGSITDEEVGRWIHFPALETANINCAHLVSGSGLVKFLRGDHQLGNLSLFDCDCTLEVCEALGQCRALKELYLFGTNLNDEGLAKLRGLPRLEILNITRTNVSGGAFEGEGASPHS